MQRLVVAPVKLMPACSLRDHRSAPKSSLEVTDRFTSVEVSAQPFEGRELRLIRLREDF